MPGMLVRPLESTMLKPPIESHASSDSLFRSLPSDLDSHDLSSSRYLAHSALGLSPFRAMDLCCTPPSSPSDIGSPRFLGLDSRDELGQKFFPRSISKLQSLMAVNEEAGLEDGSVELLPGCNELTDIGGLSIPLQQGTGSYASSNSCVNSFGSTNSSSGSMVGSPVFPDAITALQKFLPSNNDDEVVWPLDSWPMDVYSCDDFRMYEFKVRRCMRGRSHDWTECPFAHPGEKARRRDPRRIHYSGAACPDFRKGSCKRGDACEYAHGVFECWLHPARYRTQPCKDGRNCKRRVCFFAHTPEQLRVLPAGSSSSIAASHGSPTRSGLKAPSFTPTYDGSPLRQALASSLDSSLAFDGSYGAGPGLTNGFLLEDPATFGSSPRSGNHVHFGFLTGKPGYGVSGYGVSSPTSTLVGHSHSPPPLSPPLSPCVSPPMSPDFSPHSWPNIVASGLVAQASSPLSPLSPALTPAHRRHLDKLQSIPTVSIPVSESSDMDDLNFSPVATKDPGSPHAMNDLLTTLQNLRLKGRVAEAGRMPSPHWTMQQPAFRHVSRSLPCTPTKSKWACQSGLIGSECGEVGAPEHRVESGRGLRADFYGKIGKENGVENEAPDLGWVNELVK